MPALISPLLDSPRKPTKSSLKRVVQEPLRSQLQGWIRPSLPSQTQVLRGLRSSSPSRNFLLREVRLESHSEKLLLAAILRRAAYDIALYRGVKKLPYSRIWEEAHRWMFSDVDDHVTSFTCICEILNQEPATIRQKTLSLTRRDVRKYDMVDSYGRF